MASTADELLKMQQHLLERQQTRDRAIGQRDQILAQLFSDYNCATINDAQSYLDELIKEEKALTQELNDGIGEVKGTLGW